MKKVYEFFKTHKHAVTWTIFYGTAIWTLLYFLFGFDIFCSAQWHKLFRAELHGFGGFVFGLIMLTALPIYISTTWIIIRNKKPLISLSIPLPSFLHKPEPATESVTEKVAEEPQTTEPIIPDDVPMEIRSTFIRAQKRISLTDIIDTPTIPAITAQTSEVNDIPLPLDFDIPAIDEPAPIDMPTFQEINFDSGNETSQAPEHNAAEILIEYLTKNNRNFKTDKDIVITETHAIATHCDPDFWVPDNENWFAAGKTCPSPIIAAKTAADTHGVKPAIYLASRNILDIDTQISNWESDGILVIENLDQI